MQEQIKEAIEAIRPAIQNDGGDIEFVQLDDNKVIVRLTGACAGCPMAKMTLKGGVERYLHHAVSPDLVIVCEEEGVLA
ncbi:NifU family protein [Parasphaerochaeta coccoides]|uniref:Nitrogen-fixing NifU domain-containing protein n=1 Tax=Parasphaerochaeta coccoides (strain ATCC BAA-1237 / DSM 17374 / SPN1) TaxID=760011 RepID=F4GM86_PARC1|nr:NifU family protein [Parasphaerochaeta coccoides]AEC03062.1 nitrogen-fixing NifU domain-containing protein [Parasphaerochaeta coccoides DSM 17374]